MQEIQHAADLWAGRMARSTEPTAQWDSDLKIVLISGPERPEQERALGVLALRWLSRGYPPVAVGHSGNARSIAFQSNVLQILHSNLLRQMEQEYARILREMAPARKPRAPRKPAVKPPANRTAWDRLKGDD